MREVPAGVTRRLIWIGPATVVVSVSAVLIVQQIALRLLVSPRVSPLTGNEPAIFTAVLVSGAAGVRRIAPTRVTQIAPTASAESHRDASLTCQGELEECFGVIAATDDLQADG